MKHLSSNFTGLFAVLTAIFFCFYPKTGSSQETAKTKLPIFVQKDGKTYVFTGIGKGYTYVEYSGLTDEIIVNGKLMKGKQVNEKYKASDFEVASVHGKESAKRLFGIDRPVFELKFRNTEITASSQDPVLNAKQVSDDQQRFLEEHKSTVDHFSAWDNHSVVIQLKDSTVEKYNISDAAEKQLFVKKYGWVPEFPKSRPGKTTKISSRISQ